MQIGWQVLSFVGGALVAVIAEHLMWPILRKIVVNPVASRRRMQSDRKLERRLDGSSVIINGTKQYLFEFAPRGFAKGRISGLVTSEQYDLLESRNASAIGPSFPSGPDLLESYTQRKAELARPDSRFWNGSQLSPKRVTRRRDIEFEEPILNIELIRKDYANFLVIGETLERLMGDGMCQEFELRVIEQPDPLLSTDFGLIINVVTADRKVIITRRSQTAYSWNDYWHIAVAESVTKQDAEIDGRIDFFKVVQRALKEELGLELSLEAILNATKIHALNVHVKRHSWMLLIHVDLRECNLTFEQIRFRRSSGGGRDHWESKDLRSIDFNKDSILQELRTNEDQWVPFGLWCLILSGVAERVLTLDELQTATAQLRLRDRTD